MPKEADMYDLIYWSGIPGRGEFVRLVLEEAGAPYRDVGREEGDEAVAAWLYGQGSGYPAFAPPILQHGDLVLAQTAAICDYLGRRHGLVPEDEAGRAQALQVQLTVADAVLEAHDTHHPISAALYYEEQREAALQRAGHFTKERLPRFLGYFEGALRDGWLVGGRLSHADLSLFQLLCGLEYAFPKAFERAATATPGLLALRDRVAERPRIAAYLASPRRIPFKQQGIFRRYPELDS